MTKDEIRNATTRQLDEMVARQVMGWKKTGPYQWRDKANQARADGRLYCPTVDMTQAMQALRKSGHGWDLYSDRPILDHDWCSLYDGAYDENDDDQSAIVCEYADTLEIAICRALLLAVVKGNNDD